MYCFLWLGSSGSSWLRWTKRAANFSSLKAGCISRFIGVDLNKVFCETLTFVLYRGGWLLVLFANASTYPQSYAVHSYLSSSKPSWSCLLLKLLRQFRRSMRSLSTVRIHPTPSLIRLVVLIRRSCWTKISSCPFSATGKGCKNSKAVECNNYRIGVRCDSTRSFLQKLEEDVYFASLHLQQRCPCLDCLLCNIRQSLLG